MLNINFRLAHQSNFEHLIFFSYTKNVQPSGLLTQESILSNLCQQDYCKDEDSDENSSKGFV